MTEPRRPRPVVQLTLMRLREMMREPGVLFWTFGFPVLISVALGIAFRVKGPEPVVVGALPAVTAPALLAWKFGRSTRRQPRQPCVRARWRWCWCRRRGRASP